MIFFSIRGAFKSVVISVCERKWENYWRSRPLLCKSLTAALTNSSERLFISPTWGIQDLGGEEARHQGGGGGYGNTGKVMLNSETLTAKNNCKTVLLICNEYNTILDWTFLKLFIEFSVSSIPMIKSWIVFQSSLAHRFVCFFYLWVSVTSVSLIPDLTKLYFSDLFKCQCLKTVHPAGGRVLWCKLHSRLGFVTTPRCQRLWYRERNSAFTDVVFENICNFVAMLLLWKQLFFVLSVVMVIVPSVPTIYPPTDSQAKCPRWTQCLVHPLWMTVETWCTPNTMILPQSCLLGLTKKFWHQNVKYSGVTVADVRNFLIYVNRNRKLWPKTRSWQVPPCNLALCDQRFTFPVIGCAK